MKLFYMIIFSLIYSLLYCMSPELIIKHLDSTDANRYNERSIKTCGELKEFYEEVGTPFYFKYSLNDKIVWSEVLHVSINMDKSRTRSLTLTTRVWSKDADVWLNSTRPFLECYYGYFRENSIFIEDLKSPLKVVNDVYGQQMEYDSETIKANFINIKFYYKVNKTIVHSDVDRVSKHN